MADFVGQVRRDPMIGFLFAGVDEQRLCALEFQFTARMLGADMPYQGRPVGAVHARLQLMDGQFARRRRLLHKTLQAHGIADDTVVAILKHTDRLRPMVLAPEATCAARGGSQLGGIVYESWQPSSEPVPAVGQAKEKG